MKILKKQYTTIENIESSFKLKNATGLNNPKYESEVIHKEDSELG